MSSSVSPRSFESLGWFAVVLAVGIIYLFTGDLFNYRLIIHYFLYLAVLVYTLSWFAVNGIGATTTSVGWRQVGYVLVYLTFFWNTVDPLGYVPLLASVQVLLYLLYILEFPHQVFSRNRLFNRNNRFPAIILMFYCSYRVISTTPLFAELDLSRYTMWELLLTVQVLATVTFVAMVIITLMLLLNEIPQIDNRYLYVGLTVVIIGASATDSIFDNLNAFPSELIILYIYTLALLLHKYERSQSSLARIMDLVFVFGFLVVFSNGQADAFQESIVQIEEYLDVLGNFWIITLGILGFISSIYTVVSFHRISTKQS